MKLVWLPQALLLLSLMLTSCQQTPTRVYSTHKQEFKSLVNGRQQELKIDESVILIDARSSFEYSLLKIPGSINLQWTEFADHRGPFPGKLKTDYEYMARRLARLGISPNSKVIVFGKGLRGNGEEGRVAWTLFFLGVKDVQVADINIFKNQLSQKTTIAKKPAQVWSPQPNEFVSIGRSEFLSAIGNNKKRKVRIVDVRSQREYFSKTGRQFPEVEAINIDWKEFFNPSGRPSFETAEKLNAIGIEKTDAIFVISANGIRSAAVTMALLSLGFSNVRNYEGGWKELSKW